MENFFLSFAHTSFATHSKISCLRRRSDTRCGDNCNTRKARDLLKNEALAGLIVRVYLSQFRNFPVYSAGTRDGGGHGAGIISISVSRKTLSSGNNPCYSCQLAPCYSAGARVLGAARASVKRCAPKAEAQDVLIIAMQTKPL